MGSFEIKAALAEVHARIRVCPLCRLSKNRTLAVPGEGAINASIMFIGEGPGADEDRQGRPFVGAAGRLLTNLLRSNGIDRTKVFITNLVKCRPPENRDPLPDEIEACHDYLLTQIALINPRMICTLGRLAAQKLMDEKIAISREHGKARHISGILHIPLYHPAAALHQARLIDILEADMRSIRKLLEGELGTASSGIT